MCSMFMRILHLKHGLSVARFTVCHYNRITHISLSVISHYGFNDINVLTTEHETTCQCENTLIAFDAIMH